MGIPSTYFEALNKRCWEYLLAVMQNHDDRVVLKARSFLVLQDGQEAEDFDITGSGGAADW